MYSANIWCFIDFSNNSQTCKRLQLISNKILQKCAITITVSLISAPTILMAEVKITDFYRILNVNFSINCYKNLKRKLIE